MQWSETLAISSFRACSKLYQKGYASLAVSLLRQEERHCFDLVLLLGICKCSIFQQQCHDFALMQPKWDMKRHLLSHWVHISLVHHFCLSSFQEQKLNYW